MRQGVWVVLFLVALAVGPALVAQGPPLGPGGAKITGGMTKYGQFQATLVLKQGGPDLVTILAVKVYSEPSHTFLFALVDASAPSAVLNDILDEKPQGLSVSDLSGVETTFGVEPPPGQDNRITATYIVQGDKGPEARLMADVSLRTARAFSFSVEPQAGGGGIRRCGYCPPYFCGCTTCSGPAFTLCCPGCDIQCAAVMCP